MVDCWDTACRVIINTKLGSKQQQALGVKCCRRHIHVIESRLGRFISLDAWAEQVAAETEAVEAGEDSCETHLDNNILLLLERLCVAYRNAAFTYGKMRDSLRATYCIRAALGLVRYLYGDTSILITVCNFFVYVSAHTHTHTHRRIHSGFL